MIDEHLGEEEALEQARSVENFLQGAAGKNVLRLLKEEYEREWRQGKTAEEREMAWAKARVLDDFVGKCSAIMSTGKRIVIQRDQREKREKLSKRDSNR